MGDLYVEDELYDNIFHDPKFFEHFLSGPSAKLDAVLRYCRRSNMYAPRTNSWNPTTRVTRRSGPEPPVLQFLNTIVRGTYAATSSNRNSSSTPALFVDWPTENVAADSKAGELPNYLLAEGMLRDWPGVRMVVRLMRLPGHRKMGMFHLARYAKTMFAHQLHRRHIYHIMICGTEATFVRFDRAGVLYSSIVDLCKEVDTFIRALASLLMLERADEGYNPLFNTKLTADNDIAYYLDLPNEIFHPKYKHETSPKRKFKVADIIAHSSDIVGGATSVILIREVLEPTEREVEPILTRGKGKRKRVEPPPVVEERFGDSKYIMKITWRDPKAVSEFELYEKTNGMFGLAQFIWAGDAMRRCTCGQSEETCMCVTEVGHIEGLEVCDRLTNFMFSKEELGPGVDDNEGPELDTNEYRPATRKRSHRIYSYILMSSLGETLDNADSPRYWRLFNLGYIHRDVSDGNVLMLKPDQVFDRREWENPVTDLDDIEDEEIRKSEEMLREVVAVLDRDPTAMLLDFDRAARHSGKEPVKTKGEKDFHAPRKRITEELGFVARKRHRPDTTESYAFRDTSEPPSDYEEERPVEEFRTGTGPFMSAAVLGSTFGKPYRHSYLDDLESFFWMIYWAAATHVDGRAPNKYQRQEVSMLMTEDKEKLANFKANAVEGCKWISSRLALFDNSWSKSYTFKKVMHDLEDFFREVWYQTDPGMTPVEAFTRVTVALLKGIGERSILL